MSTGNGGKIVSSVVVNNGDHEKLLIKMSVSVLVMYVGHRGKRSIIGFTHYVVRFKRISNTSSCMFRRNVTLLLASIEIVTVRGLRRWQNLSIISINDNKYRRHFNLYQSIQNNAVFA